MRLASAPQRAVASLLGAVTGPIPAILPATLGIPVTLAMVTLGLPALLVMATLGLATVPPVILLCLTATPPVVSLRLATVLPPIVPDFPMLLASVLPGFPVVLTTIVPSFPPVLAALAAGLAAVLPAILGALLPLPEIVIDPGLPILDRMALGERLPQTIAKLLAKLSLPGRLAPVADPVTERQPASRMITRDFRIEALEHLAAHATAHPLDLPGVLHPRPRAQSVELRDAIGLALLVGAVAQPLQSRQTLPVTPLRVHGAGQQLVGHDGRLLLLAGNGDVPTEHPARKSQSGYGAGTNDLHVRTPSHD